MFAALIDAKVGLADPGLDEDLRRLELDRRTRDAELIAAICVADARCLYAADGHRSMNAYLRATFNWSRTDASRWMKLARGVNGLDGVGDALAAGRIGIPQVAEFAKAWANPRVRDTLNALAPTLVRHAEELPFPDFEIVLQQVVKLADEDGAAQDEADAIAGRRATAVAAGGELYLKATGGDPMVVAELIAIIDRFVEIEFQHDIDHLRAEHGDDDGVDMPRTDWNRRFDAIVNMARTANNALDQDAVHGGTADGAVSDDDATKHADGDPVAEAADSNASASDEHDNDRSAPANGSRTGRPAPLVNIVIDDATLARIMAQAGLAPHTNLDGTPVDPFTGLPNPTDLLAELVEHPDELLNRRCETSNGVPLSARHVIQALLPGHVRRVVVDSAGTVIDLGRKRRLFTGSARDAALVLLRRCQHPGCEIPTGRCQVDHAVEHHEGGETNQANAGPECPSHNREKHRRNWQVKRARNGRNYTIRQDGTIMLPVGCRTPRFPNEPRRTNTIAAGTHNIEHGYHVYRYDLDDHAPA